MSVEGNQMLERLKVKIKNQKRMSVAYLGGSITEGTGASLPAFRWSSLLHKWFQQTYPNIEWEEHNAGIGGTTSEFGTFRLDSDVLIHKPDVVFVEFAVNDNHTGEEKCLNAMESIVRRIRKTLPDTEIIFIITAAMNMYEEDYSKGTIPDSVQIHQKIADWYQIPIIHVGQAMLKEMHDKNAETSVYLTDGTHPNDCGYSLYYQVIREYLERSLSVLDDHKEITGMPELLGDGRYDNAKMIPAITSADTTFRKEEISLIGRYQGYISSNVPGDKGWFEFEGTGIGIYWAISCDSGNLRYQIDGGSIKEVSSWDKFALQFDRCNHVMLEFGLERGKHRLDFWVSDNKAEKSKGKFIRIAAFLVM